MRLYNVYVRNMFYKTTLGKKIEKFLYSLITLLFLQKKPWNEKVNKVF